MREPIISLVNSYLVDKIALADFLVSIVPMLSSPRPELKAIVRAVESVVADHAAGDVPDGQMKEELANAVVGHSAIQMIVYFDDACFETSPAPLTSTSTGSSFSFVNFTPVVPPLLGRLFDKTPVVECA